jgi:hypothetical protein
MIKGPQLEPVVPAGPTAAAGRSTDNRAGQTRTLRALVTRRALFRGRRAARVQKVAPAGATLPSRLVFGQRMSLSVSGWSSLSVGSRRI